MTESRWARWSNGPDKKLSYTSFMEAAVQADVGNPTGTGTQTPQEKAEAMGLQSDGHGGYIDPDTGQVVARTVNGELVFYDNQTASGGAVADSSGGAALTQATPSWKDPDTGQIMTPPAKAESDQEEMTIPPPTPAKEPPGYSKYIQQRTQEIKSNPLEQEEPVEA